MNMHQTGQEKLIFEGVTKELARAREKYPEWPENIVMAAAVASEEMGEVVRAANTYYWKQGDATPADITKEVIQTMAMLCRMLIETPYPLETCNDHNQTGASRSGQE